MKSNLQRLNEEINATLARHNRREVKRLKNLNKTNKQIADELGISSARVGQLLK